MESFTIFDIFIVPSFVPAIFFVVLFQFYSTYKTFNYSWTSIKGPLRNQTQMGCLRIGGESGVTDFFGDVINE